MQLAASEAHSEGRLVFVTTVRMGTLRPQEDEGKSMGSHLQHATQLTWVVHCSDPTKAASKAFWKDCVVLITKLKKCIGILDKIT